MLIRGTQNATLVIYAHNPPRMHAALLRSTFSSILESTMTSEEDVIVEVEEDVIAKCD